MGTRPRFAIPNFGRLAATNLDRAVELITSSSRPPLRKETSCCCRIQYTQRTHESARTHPRSGAQIASKDDLPGADLLLTAPTLSDLAIHAHKGHRSSFSRHGSPSRWASRKNSWPTNYVLSKASLAPAQIAALSRPSISLMIDAGKAYQHLFAMNEGKRPRIATPAQGTESLEAPELQAELACAKAHRLLRREQIHGTRGADRGQGSSDQVAQRAAQRTAIVDELRHFPPKQEDIGSATGLFQPQPVERHQFATGRRLHHAATGIPCSSPAPQRSRFAKRSLSSCERWRRPSPRS